MMGTKAEEFQKQSDDEYAILSIIPKDYDLSDPKNIKIFGERLRKSREDFFERMSDLPYPPSYDLAGRKVISQGFLAEYLGITAMTISDYENNEKGKVKKIPIKRLRRIYEMLDVTPHYLLGLVQEPDQFLLLEKNGEYHLKDGKPQVLMCPMKFESPIAIKAAELYYNLFVEDSELFWFINDLICVPPSLRKRYKRDLARMLGRKEDLSN